MMNVPTCRDVETTSEKNADATEHVRSMYTFSDQFLRDKGALASISPLWANADPLRKWSRQYEYPYVFSALLQYAQSASTITQTNALRIMDAGAGFTFFPYFIHAALPNLAISVECVDTDPIIGKLYEAMNAQRGTGTAITFANVDMRELAATYDAASYDVIYCVSVLEHTDQYAEIVRGFERLLKPGGLLVITYDVDLSPRNTRQSVERANNIDSILRATFVEEPETCNIIPSIRFDPNTMAYVATTANNGTMLPHTTLSVEKSGEAHRLPWRSATRHLTVAAQTFRKSR